MIVAMLNEATEENIQQVIERMVELGSMFTVQRARPRRFWPESGRRTI